MTATCSAGSRAPPATSATWADAAGIRTDVPECRCGKRGCVESYCGGWAIVATAVSLLNPSAVVLGGQVAAAAREHLSAGLRERIYARSLPLAIRDLTIDVSTLWPNAGVQGLARGVADLVFSPAA